MNEEEKGDIAELKTWLSSETEEFKTLIFRILASLPGSDGLEDLGFESLAIGWKEVDLLAKMCNALNTKDDVTETIDYLLSDREEFDKEEEKEE